MIKLKSLITLCFCLLVVLTFYFWSSVKKISINSLKKEELEVEIFKGNFAPTDERILHYLRKFHLFPPPSLLQGYNLSKTPKELGNIEDSIKNALKAAGVSDQKPGFFLECGANDGEFLSNTLGLEITRNWTGILIEASPSFFKQLKSKNRRAWLADVCLTGEHPEQIDFLKSIDQRDYRAGLGHIDGSNKYADPIYMGGRAFNKKTFVSEGKVSCVPLHSILAAIGRNSVDFLSLDIEGHEYKVLKAVPFDKLDIKIIHVEQALVPEGKLALKTLLEENGYSLFFESKHDYIFTKRHT